MIENWIDFDKNMALASLSCFWEGSIVLPALPALGKRRQDGWRRCPDF
jgi:hypothetical protein